jgi:hypothetical protein
VEASKAEVDKLTKHVEDLASRAAKASRQDTQGGEEVGGDSRISSSRQRSLIETRIEDGVRTLVNVPRSLVRGARALPLLQVSEECVLYLMCSLWSVFSIECVLYRMCSL